MSENLKQKKKLIYFLDSLPLHLFNLLHSLDIVNIYLLLLTKDIILLIYKHFNAFHKRWMFEVNRVKMKISLLGS